MSSIPRSTTVNFSTAADHEIAAARTGEVVVVKGWAVQATTANNISFKSGSSTVLVGPMPAGANGGSVGPVCESGWVATASGESLNLTLSGAVQTGGVVVWEYRKV